MNNASKCFALAVMLQLTAKTAMTSMPSEKDSSCVTTGKLEMSHGFVEAISDFTQPGIGSCIKGACTFPLAVCPSSTCCLPNDCPSTSSRGCGCLIKNEFGTFTCEDPKSLSVSVTGCDEDIDNSLDVSVQLLTVSKGNCLSSSSFGVVSTPEGEILLRLEGTVCLHAANRSSRQLDSLQLLKFAVENVLRYNIFRKGAKEADKLAGVVGGEHVENLISHHKSFTPSSNP